MNDATKRNLRLIVEYDGTEFFGWQRQRETRTVQGVIEDAVARVFGQRADVVGAGRTDAGVHAVDYPCNFRVHSAIAVERVARALNAHLPADVVVKSAADAHPTFNARFDALARRYAYSVSTARTSLWRRTRYAPRFRFDPDRMGRAAAFLVGEHDFTSFTPAHNRAHPVCRVAAAEVARADKVVTITVEADRFLHHMVRIIVGTLLEVGRGRFEPERVVAILGKRDRREAGPTAPPLGLALVAVRYPGECGGAWDCPPSR
jgi:tRNA pseudouridine38-40 synthase